MECGTPITTRSAARRCLRLRGQKGLEGIVAKRRASCYEERRSGEWLKIKIRHRLEAVIAGYTETKGSRTHFGSLVLGLYDSQGRLIHVGQAGSGFNQKSLGEISRRPEEAGDQKQSFFRRSRRSAKGELGEARTRGRDRVRGVDRRHDPRQRSETASSGVPWASRRQRSERMPPDSGRAGNQLRTENSGSLT